MSKTTQYRYEVSAEGYGIIEHAQTFGQAQTVAFHWIERENMPVVIFDRMARKTKPNLFDVTKCPGEAHKNPYIDHCAVCMPNWGIIVKAREERLTFEN